MEEPLNQFVFAPGCALLLAEETVPGTVHPDAWHKELDEFIAHHGAVEDGMSRENVERNQGEKL
jgi:hypothetical protein